ncbi:hypothetical protein T310_3700 [Rasamsonia emersonii CBS 393.64]|uniref:Uncharacterized protein n=1 Tax=Rasamsonia emersonii (strain ATCC 16479 / CBS 393.64 / IMI 116815) TaxID=1408163 RepID=A0A0F4YW00_RASE3|nr:hypothetical protein T310_3700 [Rasamsonia emersonii CBS 393.64]KKA22265.1 hypothetical protein T310_3700 [Rasamsonia emersonii CBS 393.64]
MIVLLLLLVLSSTDFVPERTVSEIHANMGTVGTHTNGRKQPTRDACKGNSLGRDRNQLGKKEEHKKTDDNSPRDDPFFMKKYLSVVKGKMTAHYISFTELVTVSIAPGIAMITVSIVPAITP